MEHNSRNTLQSVLRTHVTFDPSNPEHRKAYRTLRTTGKQDPNLRFLLEPGFTTLITMMQAKLADWASEEWEEADAAEEEPVFNNNAILNNILRIK
jgi:hypothetical protein